MELVDPNHRRAGYQFIYKNEKNVKASTKRDVLYYGNTQSL